MLKTLLLLLSINLIADTSLFNRSVEEILQDKKNKPIPLGRPAYKDEINEKQLKTYDIEINISELSFKIVDKK